MGVAGEQAQGFEAFEDFLHVGLLGALEGCADFLDGPGFVGAGDQIADGGDLFGEFLGPGSDGRWLHDGGFLGNIVGVLGGGELAG